MFTLVSHPLCPYVQRASIVLAEKAVPFERIDVDLSNKPQWFLDLSPTGKTPVLVAEGRPIFESAVICEYLEDTHVPALHPADALERARHRAWMEFGSAVLNDIAAFYSAKDEPALQACAEAIRRKLARIELQLRDGPWFAGERFSIVDAVFAPVFRYFDAFDAIGDFSFFAGTRKVVAWRRALAERPSVREAVAPDFPQRLLRFLHERRSALTCR